MVPEMIAEAAHVQIVATMRLAYKTASGGAQHVDRRVRNDAPGRDHAADTDEQHAQ